MSLYTQKQSVRVVFHGRDKDYFFDVCVAPPGNNVAAREAAIRLCEKGIKNREIAPNPVLAREMKLNRRLIEVRSWGAIWPTRKAKPKPRIKASAGLKLLTATPFIPVDQKTVKNAKETSLSLFDPPN